MGSLLGLSRPISKMTHIIFRCWRTVTGKAWTFRKWQQGWHSAAVVAVKGVVGDVALVGVAVGIGGGGVLLIWLVLSCWCWWYWWCCWWWCTATIWSGEFPKSRSVQWESQDKLELLLELGRRLKLIFQFNLNWPSRRCCDVKAAQSFYPVRLQTVNHVPHIRDGNFQS